MSTTAEEIVKELDGWNTLDLDSEELQAVKASYETEGRAIASRYHRVFVQNADGKKILEDMIRTTLMRATVNPDDTQFAAGIREGRADLVRQILQNIEIAEKQ